MSKVSVDSEMEKFSQKCLSANQFIILKNVSYKSQEQEKHVTLGRPGFRKCKAISMGEKKQLLTLSDTLSMGLQELSSLPLSAYLIQ